jgi:2-dehydropantoate 2-reductase
MRIIVMGVGGVGGYFGGKLAAGGHDVTFIARGAHGEAIRRDGLRVASIHGDFRVHPVRCVEDPAEAPPADAALFCVKLTDTETAGRALLPVVEKGASVFTFQNGVESAERLDAILGEGRTVSGVAYISATLGEPGQVLHKALSPRIVFGETNGEKTARVETLSEACRDAGVNAEAIANITHALWLKFAMLASFASITGLTRATIGALRGEPRTRALLQALIEEAVAVGVAKGAGLVADDVQRILAGLDSVDGAARASMAFDIDNGKPLESPGLSGAVVRIGKGLGVPTPTHEFFYNTLAVWEKGRIKSQM